MKKNKLILFAIILMLGISTVFFAGADDSDVIVSMQIDNPYMKINGISTEIDNGRGTAPVISNSRTLVPIRSIVEAFGGNVSWNPALQQVTLTMDKDQIRLIIESDVGYLNNQSHKLDVSPTIINGRTMLPIRFVAEGFNLGVAWDNTSRTITLIKNAFDNAEYNKLQSILPSYSGKPYVQINGNKPMFDDYEIISASFEYYSKLDELGRCDVCMASISTDTMPTEERKSISSVKPSGWHSVQYDNVDGKSLYNRCHLIGFQLTAENANEQNLITGTRYLNVDGMLPFENEVAEYIDNTGNHVMYRVTPVFTKNNLVADGVLIEAYSVEDNGRGISFCVYCYNVQPNIVIDYATGSSRLDITSSENYNNAEQPKEKVYRTPTGKKYHFQIECGGKNSYETTLSEAISSGLSPCAKCGA